MENSSGLAYVSSELSSKEEKYEPKKLSVSNLRTEKTAAEILAGLLAA